MSKKVGCLVAGGLLLFIVVMVALTLSTPEKPKSKPKPQKQDYDANVDLRAGVKFDGKQFTITNRDPFAWRNVKMEVNSGLIASGYILREDKMEANTTYTVGALQFAKPDGERLNPYATKPLNFTITCDVPKGKGFWYGGWK